jgi:hypothetical protein
MLKTKMAEIPIYGPGGDPSPKPSVSRYTKIPWEQVQADDHRADGKQPVKEHMPAGGWRLSDSNILRTTSPKLLRLHRH